MFLATYKTTIKTLIRSTLLWIILIFVIFVAMQRATGDNIRITLLDDNFKILGYITDTDPEFVLDFDYYIQTLLNSTKGWIMLYAMPIFCVVSSMLVLNRSYGDGFFEIEKCGGVTTSSYLYGRFLAALTINIAVCLTVTFLCVHYYYFSRGGIENFNLITYLMDSTLRVFRIFVCAMLPAMLFFMCITWLVGCITQSGFTGAIVGIGYVLIVYCSKTILVGRFPDMYHDYLNPNSSKLYQYWTFFDTEWFNEKLTRNPFTNGNMLTCIGIVVGSSIVLMVISYFCIRKRNK